MNWNYVGTHSLGNIIYIQGHKISMAKTFEETIIKFINKGIDIREFLIKNNIKLSYHEKFLKYSEFIDFSQIRISRLETEFNTKKLRFLVSDGCTLILDNWSDNIKILLNSIKDFDVKFNYYDVDEMYILLKNGCKPIFVDFEVNSDKLESLKCNNGYLIYLKGSIIKTA